MTEKIKQNGFTRRSFIKGAVVGASTAAMVGFGIKKAEAIPAAEVQGKWDAEADVVVVGAGGGGLAAAIEAADAGAEVLVLEVMVNVMQGSGLPNESLYQGMLEWSISGRETPQMDGYEQIPLPNKPHIRHHTREGRFPDLDEIFSEEVE